MTIYALDGVMPQFPPSGDYWVAPSAELIGNVILEEETSFWYCLLYTSDAADD